MNQQKPSIRPNSSIVNDSSRLYQIYFFVPESHLEVVKDALFSVGAGKIGDYQKCAWQIAGQGQFEPMEGSQPFIGRAMKLERVLEYRVEMVCAESIVKSAIQALRDAHPYEEPAYGVIPLQNDLFVGEPFTVG